MTEQNPYGVGQAPQPVAGFPETHAAQHTESHIGSEHSSSHVGAALLGETAEMDLGAERSPAAIFLDDMRRYNRESGQPLARRNMPPTPYAPALDALLGIHRGRFRTDETAPLSESHVARFLTNVIRFRAETRLAATDKPVLDHDFLEDLYTLYVDDVQAFAENSITKPDRTALFHAPQILSEIEKRYSRYRVIGKKETIQAFEVKRSNPMQPIDELIADINHVKKIVEPRLRAEYKIEGNWSLPMVKEMCWSKEGGEGAARKIIQTMQELRNLHPKARLASIETWAKGKVIPKLRKSDTVNDLFADTPNLRPSEDDLAEGVYQLGLLREARLAGDIHIGGAAGRNAGFAPETARLEQIMEANWRTTFEPLDIHKEVRRLWASVRAYNRSCNTEENESRRPLGTDLENLYTIFVAFAQDIAELQKEASAREAAHIAWFHGPGIHEHYRTEYANEALLTPGIINTLIARSRGDEDVQIKRWLSRMRQIHERYEGVVSEGSLRRFANFTDGVNRIGRCIALQGKVLPEYPWLTKWDVENAFIVSKEAEKNFSEWAPKVQALMQDTSCSELTLTQIKRLARNEGDAKTVADGFLGRIQEIFYIHNKRSVITPEYARRWAIAPRSYEGLVEKHIKRADSIGELLRAAGVQATDLILGRLAFKSEPSLETITSNYVKKRSVLIREYRDDPDVEQWMIDQVASLDIVQIQYMRPKLKTLIEMKRQGAFDGPTIDTLADAAAAARRFKQLAPYLHRLTPVDREAVATVLGFTDSSDRDELQMELDVPDLDAYVMEEIIPHLINKIRNPRRP